MEVALPKTFNRHTMYDLLASVINRDLEPYDKVIDFNFCSLRFIEPSGITILSNLFEWLYKEGVQVNIIYPGDYAYTKSNAIHFLDDSMFFHRYTKKTLINTAQVRPTTIPLELISWERSFQWLEGDFTHWLSRRLGVSIPSLVNIKMCFGEIFNNINDHAQQNIGCVFAQHYPKINEIKIAVSDFGVGIPDNIRRISPGLKDHEALLKAIEDGFTSKTSPRNLGAGLHTLVANVVNDNKGSVHIHSNYGILECTYGYNGLQVQAISKDSFYPGTFIEVVLKTDNIENLDDIEEEFEW